MMIENEQTNKDVTEFLGIPVDGDPYSMRQKLIEKGFEFVPKISDEEAIYGSDKWDEIGMMHGWLKGYFNSEPVKIEIQTNKGKVWRVSVYYDYDSVGNIIIKFDALVKQFNEKGNYTRGQYSGAKYYVPYNVDDADFFINDFLDFSIDVDEQKYKETYYQGNSKMNRVWFLIKKEVDKFSFEKYRIIIHYENQYNAPKELKSNNDVIKFLGIPVDGDPESMREKLIEIEEKRFKFIPGSDKTDDPRDGGILTGIFNNEQVDILIQNNPHTGKVWRIVVSNQNDYNKYKAIRKFNDLVTQFNEKENYTRYTNPANTCYIPDDVDDEYFDINVEKQKYKAIYYQGNDKMKLVWFMISKDKNSDKYNIVIHYENRYNEPEDGEDL